MSTSDVTPASKGVQQTAELLRSELCHTRDTLGSCRAIDAILLFTGLVHQSMQSSRTAMSSQREPPETADVVRTPVHNARAFHLHHLTVSPRTVTGTSCRGSGAATPAARRPPSGPAGAGPQGMCAPAGTGTSGAAGGPPAGRPPPPGPVAAAAEGGAAVAIAATGPRRAAAAAMRATAAPIVAGGATAAHTAAAASAALCPAATAAALTVASGAASTALCPAAAAAGAAMATTVRRAKKPAAGRPLLTSGQLTRQARGQSLA